MTPHADASNCRSVRYLLPLLSSSLRLMHGRRIQRTRGGRYLSGPPPPGYKRPFQTLKPVADAERASEAAGTEFSSSLMATEGLLNCIFEASIVASDTEVDQRPYHRNCNCPLHKSAFARVCGGGRRLSPSANTKAKISYPVRRSWSENCLVMLQHHAPSPSPSPSPSLIEKPPSCRRLKSQGSLQQLADRSGISWDF